MGEVCLDLLGRHSQDGEVDVFILVRENGVHLSIHLTNV
jgi:hypothetical protein